MSPSMRREWIEISGKAKKLYSPLSLPPCGGSGLKCSLCTHAAGGFASPSMRREWIEIQRTLYHTATVWSPSMRREWIEIADFAKDAFENMVSLHAEGVD